MDLVWGYCGILSLGHFAFFGLGGYMIGMWLMTARTEAVIRANLAESTIPPTEGEVSQATALQIFSVVGAEDWPWMWAVSDSLILSLLLVMLVPGLLALVFGWLAFRSRVTGVYLSILTQAMTLALSLYLFQNDTGLRGNNGLSGLQNIPGADAIGQERLSVWFFWASALALGLGYVGAAWLVSGKFGSIVRGIRDDELRVRFLGYPVEGLQAGGIHRVGHDLRRRGRALLPAGRQSSIPTRSRPSPRSTLAVWVAIGGRGRLYGAVIGAAAVSLLSTWFTSGRAPNVDLGFYEINWIDWWPVLLGLGFVLVTLFRAEGAGGPVRLSRAEGGHMSTLLEVQGVSVTFDGFKAINNLSFTIGLPELRAVIGPNGAGKTTFMDIVTGKTRPDAGTVRWGEMGHSLLSMSEARIAREGIGRKFQRPTVFEDQTVRENLRVSLKKPRGPFSAMFDRVTPEDTARIEEIAAEIGLSDHLKRKAGILSHGQKQWLEIGMLLAQDPRLLLVDEPAAGMTTEERNHTADLLKRLAKSHAVVVVEHDMEFVRRLDCRVTVLHEGSVLAEGSLEHVMGDERVIEVYLGR